MSAGPQGIVVYFSLSRQEVRQHLDWDMTLQSAHFQRYHSPGTLHSTPCSRNTDSPINPLKPKGPYKGRTATLTSTLCILYIYSTNIGTEYFKHGIYSPFFSSSKCSLFHKSNIFGSRIIHILYTECAKIKKITPAPKG